MATDKPKNWSDFARKALELSGISQSELARRLSAKLNKSVSQGAIQSRLANPNGLPPQDAELTAWADAMRLDGFHREHFIRLALLERTPPPIRKELQAVESRLERSEVRTRKLEQEADDLRKQLNALRSEFAKAAAEAAELLP
jgi:hypothetical protein